MKLRILSDLHLEFFPFDIPELPSDNESVLVLAGDIAPFACRTILEPFLVGLAERFHAIVYVPGNHEYYGSVWPGAINDVRGWGLPRNVHILDRSSVHIDDVTFLGATLWTDFNNGDPWSMYGAQRGMMDYHAISTSSTGGATLSPSDTLADHCRSRTWLEDELAELLAKRRTVVLITHHGLTPKSIHPQYFGNPLNSAFVSDLSDILLAYSPALAIHGHTHSSFDYRVNGEGSTRIITNPRGYAKSTHSQENEEFDPLLLVEI